MWISGIPHDNLTFYKNFKAILKLMISIISSKIIKKKFKSNE